MATTRRNQTGNTAAVQAILPNTAPAPSGGGAGGGGAATPVNRPAASPTGTAPLIGQPEFLPQHTFISVPLPNDNGFIQNAINYHTISGLNPRSVQSIEEILELLADPAKTGGGVLDRIRIVSHFLTPRPGEPERPNALGINFLTAGSRGALTRHFEGFAESSLAGLRALLTFNLPGNQTALSIFASSETVLLSAVRTAGQGTAVDDVFPSGGTPSAAKKEFVILHGAKWLLAHGVAISSTTLRTDLASAYDLLLADLKATMAKPPDNVPTTKSDALATAIAALANLPAGVQFVQPADEGTYALNVAAALTAVPGDTFRKKLLAVRPRFDRYTTIDIRGCLAGNDTPYLTAIQTFFGQSSTVRPAVSGPKLFQRFNQIAMVQPHGNTPQARVVVLNLLHNNGLQPEYSAASLRSQFSTWADGYGISSTHLDFWRKTFELPAIEFCKLDWRASIPARNVTISRLDGLAGASFADVFPRISDIFFIIDTARPTAAQITRIEAQRSKLSTWTTQLDAAVDPTALATHFANYKAIYEAVDTRMDVVAFHTSSQRVIPPSPPAAITAAQVETFRTNLKTFIQTHANSIFAPARIFQAAGLPNTRDAPARLRYFLALGLPFQLADTTAVGFDAQRLVLFDDQTATGRQHEAIRHWIRAGWRGVALPNIPNPLNFDLGRHSAWLVVGRTTGPSRICPHPSYMAEIVTVPA